MIIKAIQQHFIAELAVFDKPLPYTMTEKSGYRQAVFEIGEDTITVDFNKLNFAGKFPYVEIAFYRKRTGQQGVGSLALTGKFDSISAYSTVLHIIREQADYINEYPAINFMSASGNRGNRTKLYARIARLIGNQLGWKAYRVKSKSNEGDFWIFRDDAALAAVEKLYARGKMKVEYLGK